MNYMVEILIFSKRKEDKVIRERFRLDPISTIQEMCRLSIIGAVLCHSALDCI